MEKRITVTMGIDLGDRYSYCFGVDESTGEVVHDEQVATRPGALREAFAGGERMRVVIEAGTHSPWVSRQLEDLGHEVVVANPRQLGLIHSGARKSDRLDAETLARLGRVDVALLAPIQHRGKAAQADLAVIRSRDGAVRARTLLVNTVRGQVKSFGARLPKCSTDAFHRKVLEHIPEELRPALEPLVKTIGDLTASIAEYARRVEQLCSERYPETGRLRQVTGVGAVTALTYVLTLEDPSRFGKSRQVGPYLGLTPKRDQSGDVDKQLRITKTGNVLLRRLLVGAASYVLGPFGPDCKLRRWGLARAAGGKAAKKRATVAVARKLAVLLHSLWVSGEDYEPLRGAA